MKKIFLFALSLFAITVTTGARSTISSDSLAEVRVNEPYLHELTPKYTLDYVKLDDIGHHWFMGVQGGFSFFIGSPVGCGDIFDRSMPTFNAYIGKWLTPSVSVRGAFQGLKFKDSNLHKYDYQLYHADLMYNLANWFRSPTSNLPRWDFTPYIGLGFVHANVKNTSCPCVAPSYHFALTYGVQTRYRIGRNFHLTGELGGFSTFKNFDLNGSSKAFGDNMLSASIGVGVTLGNPHWKRAVDSTPYMNQNSGLLSYIDRLEKSNQALHNRLIIDQKTLDELKKILELEGLLSKYGYLFDDSGKGKNNYRGLLSLRSRLSRTSGNESAFALENNGKSPNLLNIPIYFFFKLGKAELTDNSQLINLDELAKVVNDHNLKVKIIGAADSETGSNGINEELSKKRSRFIAKALEDRGVATENMKGVALGGIREFDNAKDNRYSKVAIYLELDADKLK